MNDLASDSLHSRRAETVAEIARAYARRRQHHVGHTGHTVHRLLEAVGDLIGKPVSDAERARMVLDALKELSAAVSPYAHMSEHVEGLGAPFESARRAIAKAEGRCQALRFASLGTEGAS